MTRKKIYTAKTSKEAYELLLKGERVCDTVTDGNQDTSQIRYLQRVHPCLALRTIDHTEDGVRVYQIDSEAREATANPSAYYEGEALPDHIEHALRIDGVRIEGVVRDSYYITQRVIDGDVKEALRRVRDDLADYSLKAYPYLAGLDIYYTDGRHVQFDCAEGSLSQHEVAFAVRSVTAKVIGGKLVWQRRTFTPARVPCKGVSRIRAHFFGKLIMM